MMVSTRGRYALRVMIDLAEHGSGTYIAMKSVAERQEISLKYLEKILRELVSAHLVEGVHGRGGGYRLTRAPQDYSVYEILQQTEGSLAPVSCLECGTEACKRSAECRTLPMWTELDRLVSGYLGKITLADLMRQEN